MLWSLKTFFQLDYQDEISLYLTEATPLHYFRKSTMSSIIWCIFSPITLWASRTLKPGSFHEVDYQILWLGKSNTWFSPSLTLDQGCWSLGLQGPKGTLPKWLCSVTCYGFLAFESYPPCLQTPTPPPFLQYGPLMFMIKELRGEATKMVYVQ